MLTNALSASAHLLRDLATPNETHVFRVREAARSQGVAVCVSRREGARSSLRLPHAHQGDRRQAALTTFQTDRDREAQFHVAAAIELAWNVRVERPGSFTHFDYWIFRGDRHVASVEIKRRYVRRSTYPTLLLSAHKSVELMAMRPPALLIVQWDDATGWFSATDINIGSTRIGGRSPRDGSVHDLELVVDIPTNAFRPLEDWPACLDLSTVP